MGNLHYIYGVFVGDSTNQPIDSSLLSQANIGTESAEKISIIADGDHWTTQAVRVRQGTLNLGMENSAIVIEAHNGYRTRGLRAEGAQSTLNLLGESLTVKLTSDKEGGNAEAVRFGDKAIANIDAAVTIDVSTSSSSSARGISVMPMWSDNDDSSVRFATESAVFTKSVEMTLNSAEGQARGIGVLSGGATNILEGEEVEGAKLVLKDSVAMDLTGNTVRAIWMDNNIFDGTTGSTATTNIMGYGTTLEINGFTTITGTGEASAYGISSRDGANISMNGLKANLESSGDTLGIYLRNNDGFDAQILGAVDLSVKGVTTANAVQLEDANLTLGSSGSTVKLTAENSGGTAYAVLNTGSSVLALAGNTTTTGLLSSEKAIVVTGSLQMANGLADVEKGLLDIQGKLITTSSDIFAIAASEESTTVGSVLAVVPEKLIFGENSVLTLTDEYYTREWLQNAKDTFSQSTELKGPASYVMTGQLAGNLTLDDVYNKEDGDTHAGSTLDMEENTPLEADKARDDFTFGNIHLKEGNVANIVGKGETTLVITGAKGSLFVNAKGEAAAGSLHINDASIILGGPALGEKAPENVGLEGSLTASGEASITIAGGTQQISFNISDSIETLDNSSLVITHNSEVVVNDKVFIDTSSTLQVGTEEKASEGNYWGRGSLKTSLLQMFGKMLLDPVWIDGVENNASVMVSKLELGDTGQVTVGQNSTLTIGSEDEDWALQAVKDAGHKLASNDITAALFIDSESGFSIGNGSITVDGSKNEAVDGAAGTINIASNGLLGLDVTDDIIENNETLLKGATLNLAEGSYLVLDLEDVTATDDISVVLADVVNNEGTSLTIIPTNGPWFGLSIEGNKLTAQYDPTSVLTANGAIVSSMVLPVLQLKNNALADQMNTLINVDKNYAGAAALYNKAVLMGTASGAQAVGINMVSMVADSIEQHGSLLAAYSHKKVGADMWVDLNGSFSKANDYKVDTGTYGYRSDIAGATLGADYSFGNGLAAGLAFSIGTGSVRGKGMGSGIKNSIDYLGVNLYGAWSTDYFNLVGNVGYLQSKNDIKSMGNKGKPDVKAFSVGLRAEKDFAISDAFAVTPHIGVRYMNIDMDSFTAGGFKYSADKANLVQFPIGVAFSGNYKASCGAEVKPFLDLTVQPAAGDRKVKNKFGIAGTSVADSFDARIANNAMYQAKVGLNASKGNHTFGLNYGIGGGSDGRLDQQVQAKYRYSF